MFKLILTCLFGLISLVYSDNYEILIPKSVKPGDQFRFSLSTYSNRTENYTCNFAMKNEDEEILVDKNVTLISNSSNFLALDLPKQIEDYQITFYATSEKGFIINGFKTVKVNRKLHSVYIQTDKGIYKQGQKVNFRVISFDQTLRAFDENFNITIRDGKSNLIKQLTKKNSSYGVITDHLQLSDPAVDGQWVITATSQHAEVNQYFTVTEYVLPKFEVIVKVPSFYHVNVKNSSQQEDLTATIIAKYTYGKPVDGEANIRVSFEWADYTKFIKKTFLLNNGKADLALNFEELLKLNQTIASSSTNKLHVEAHVTDILTGITLKGENTVPFKPHVYQLEFLSSSPSNFKPGLSYEAYIRILKSDNTQPDIKKLFTADSKSKEITVDIFYSYEDVNKTHNATSLKLNVDKEGISFLKFETESDAKHITLKASFFEEISNDTIRVEKMIQKFETRDNNSIQLILSNENKVIKPDIELKFEVKTSLPSERFQLHIVSKGNLVKSYNFEEAANTTHYVSINVTQELATQWAPEARFLVTFVTADNELVADSLSLDVIDYMANKVELSFKKNQTEPGENVNLTIKSCNNSFVALLAVDQSVLLLDKGNDFTSEKVAKELLTEDNQYGGSCTKEVIEKTGLQFITNLFAQEPKRGRSGVPAAGGLGSDGRIRRNFPETFIWNETITDSEGEKVLNLTVPDTITSWVTTGFSMSPDKGLGFTRESTKLGVIKPLFVSLDLPYSIIRGEEFVLQANVFNYFKKNLTVNVELMKSEYFKVRDCGTNSLASMNVTKTIQAEEDKGTPVYFWIVPQVLGHIPIQVRAIAPDAGDAVEVTLVVKPEGQPQSYSVSELIQLNSTHNFSKSYNIDLPKEGVLVNESVRIEVTVVGDIMGATLSNIQDLLKMPYGCGEQNLLGFAPDVYILEYLQRAGRLTEPKKYEGIEYITEGYQKQLTYQRTDGSFSAFGSSDPAGSTWLSAFTIKCFHQAKSFIPVEESDIARTIRWIFKYQKNGTFVEPPNGKVIHTGMQGGTSKGIAMTAYVLISILENRNNTGRLPENFQEGITEAVTYLNSTYNSYSNDSYVLAIVAYAFYKAENPELVNVLNLLNTKAIVKDGLKYWESTPRNLSRYSRPTSHAVELASYVLLVYAQQKDLNNAMPIAKWLLTQRNAFGGFASTQDTVLGLEALASFASLLASSRNDKGIAVSVTNNADGRKHDFDAITQNNEIVLQSVQLPANTTNVQIEARHAGIALAQLTVTYNIQSNDTNKALALSLHTEYINKTLSLNVSTSWNSTKESGMVVVEVNILTGYEVVNKDKIETGENTNLKKIEEKIKKLIFYIDELTAEGRLINVVMTKVIPVTHVKPALVKVYRYYDTEDVASSYYTADTQVTWKGACPQCCEKKVES